MSDKQLEKIGSRLPGSEGHTGRPAEDNRRFINAVFGFCVPELCGAIFRPITGIGKIRIVASVAGETEGFGKEYWNWSQTTAITNG
jgi:hypothetical protein